MFLLQDIFTAYLDCRKNKRNTVNALNFELNLENNLIKLYQDIKSRKYKVETSICFIVNKPVKREIFAGNFRDRIIHHFIINKLNQYFEKSLLYDSYSCRKEKGTLFGVSRVKKFIRQCSNNYQKDCWILKMDIQGFFMHIDKSILYKQVWLYLWQERLNNNFDDEDFEVLDYLIKKVIFNDPTKNYIKKSPLEEWDGLPSSKSFFNSNENCGLPIGNLTSQIFANVYMNTFDKWIKDELKVEFYGRYVDDFLIIHQNKEFLLNLIPKIKEFLQDKLKLTLHPKKIYFQHYSKGIQFLGTTILPFRTFASKKIRNSFYNCVKEFVNEPNKEEKIKQLENKVFSYMGVLSKSKNYKFIKKTIYPLRKLAKENQEIDTFVKKLDKWITKRKHKK